ncbi:hypothetical protein VYU27_005371 [Nannochloropsis oceanica]
MASSSFTSSSANSSPPESSPWNLTTIGKGDSRRLQDNLVATNRGGLECQGCGRVFLRYELDWANKKGVNTTACGVLTGHSQSKQHKAEKPEEVHIITSFFGAIISPSHHSSCSWRPRQRQRRQVAGEHQQGQADR